MKPSARLIILSTFILALVMTPVIVSAQGPGQAFDWPEIGLSLTYPAGWVEMVVDEQSRALASDPSFDPDANDPPASPVVLVVGLPIAFAGEIGSSEDVLNLFAAEFGAMAAVTPEIMTISGVEVLRARGLVPEETFLADVAVAFSSSNIIILIGAWPTDQDYEAGFTEILNSMVISASAEAPMPPTTGSGSGSTEGALYNGVRITLDQTLTDYWNEIDAIELVGSDASGFEVRQWGISAEATSSYGTDSWSAMQATGMPDTPECGDHTTAWASETSNGQDALTVYYGMPVSASEVNIYQTLTPGAIVMVELLPADGSMPVTVFEGIDPTLDCPGIFSIPVGAGASAAGGGAIGIGETVSGSISDAEHTQYWEFQGNAGDVVTITMTASTMSGLDSYLYLLDANGVELAYNDDADDPNVGSLNSQIVNFALPAAGTYTIQATRFAEEFGSSSGAYDLTLVVAGGSAPLPPKGAGNAGGGPIVAGQSIMGNITDVWPEQNWTFQANQGDVVTITMSAVEPNTGLDSYLYLYDPAGNELTSNDDYSSNYDSQIANFIIPATGAYTIRTTRFGDEMGSTSGPYSLLLEQSAAALPVGSLGFGETVNGEISDAVASQLWTFDGVAGNTVTITMRSRPGSSLDSYLFLLDSTGTVLAENDDADDPNVGSLNSQIVRYTLPATGTYTIRATRYAEEYGSTSGSYMLNLRLGK